jgi:sigma-E factor negative regulatory protein RseA
MERISQLMDGELGRRESQEQIERLERDMQLGERWESYHLIRDVLRNESELRADFCRRLHERLQQEPTVIAPHTRLAHRAVRQTLPLAAGFGGVALVAWLALSFQAAQAPKEITAKAAEPKAQIAVAPVTAAAQGSVSEYMRAHQEFSPSTAMQGVASYVRTVSIEEVDAGR